MKILFFWIIGLSFSLFAGEKVINLTLKRLKEKNFKDLRKFLVGDKKTKKSKQAEKEIKESEEILDISLTLDWAIGYLERFFFTSMVALNVAGFPIAMIGWTAVKMAINFQAERKEKSLISSSLAFCSLFGSLLSMLFALAGGFICQLWKVNL